MSANNYMEIKETKKGFEVIMRDIGAEIMSGQPVICSNLRLAIKEAQKSQTEYGLYIKLKK